MFFGNKGPSEYNNVHLSLSRINTDPNMSDDKEHVAGLSPLLKPRTTTAREHKEISPQEAVLKGRALTARPRSNTDVAKKSRRIDELATQQSTATHLQTPKSRTKTPKTADLKTTKSIFERNKDWLQSKNTKIIEQRADREKREIDGCTFQPQIQKKKIVTATETPMRAKDLKQKTPANYTEIQKQRKKSPMKLDEKQISPKTNEIIQINSNYLKNSLVEPYNEGLNNKDNLSKEANEDAETWTSIYKDIEKQKKLLNDMLLQSVAEPKQEETQNPVSD